MLHRSWSNISSKKEGQHETDEEGPEKKARENDAEGEATNHRDANTSEVDARENNASARENDAQGDASDNRDANTSDARENNPEADGRGHSAVEVPTPEPSAHSSARSPILWLSATSSAMYLLPLVSAT